MPTIVQGPAWTTVTGTWLPSSPKICVIPTLRPSSASFLAIGSLESLELDLDVDARGEVELHQRIDGLGRRVDDVEEALVRAHLELLARGLVDVRRAEHRPAVDDRREQHGARHARAGAPHGLDDLLDRPIEEAMIVRLEPDADLLIGGQGHHLATRRSR